MIGLYYCLVPRDVKAFKTVLFLDIRSITIGLYDCLVPRDLKDL